MAKLALAALTSFTLIACDSGPAPTPFPDLPVVTLARTKVLTTLSGTAGPWIPEQTLVVRAGVPGVFIERAGRARFQMIKPGPRRDKYVQVLSGLYGDETILAGELGQVHDGSPLASN